MLRFLGSALLAAVAFMAAGCDLTTPAPAQIEDRDIVDPVILPALLTGAESDYTRGLTQQGGGGIVIAGGLLVDELVHSGSWVGLQGPSWGLAGDHWVEAQSRWSEPSRARFTTEHAIELGREIVEEQLGEDPDAHPTIARVTFFAGMAHRTLADNFCNVVYDGGPLLHYSEGWPRALEHYADAIMRANRRIAAVEADPELEPGDVASAVSSMETLIQAAHGAMAQTYLLMASEGMGNQFWDQALEHAEQVDTEFVFSARMQSGDRNSNRIPAWTRSRTETTMWQTPFGDWGLNREDPDAGGDPRVPYDAAMIDGEYERAYDSRRPAWLQAKFTSTNNNLPLVKGTEMRLIEGEVALARGDWQTAIDKINEVRAYQNETAPSWWLSMLGPDPLPEVTATNEEEAWLAMMKERGIVLYLEGRRVADIRRWQTTPGRDLVPFTVVRRNTDQPDPWTDPRIWVYERELGDEMIPPEEMCLQVSRDEKASNPNING
ncbi:MAG TPA: RagB/SusD family nutrient uptake outer membrane protein [Longimicrobiales bacterium]|nr:RagB/SusD family nutrient uptake outer membrane protein [Longimicrobiales bacterium]